jgi:hypothetical protein
VWPCGWPLRASALCSSGWSPSSILTASKDEYLDPFERFEEEIEGRRRLNLEQRFLLNENGRRLTGYDQDRCKGRAAIRSHKDPKVCYGFSGSSSYDPSHFITTIGELYGVDVEFEK